MCIDDRRHALPSYCSDTDSFAKIVASVGALSDGRVTLGVGAGWHKPEFTCSTELYDCGDRISRTIEEARIIKELRTSGRLDYLGRYYNVREYRCPSSAFPENLPTYVVL